MTSPQLVTDFPKCSISTPLGDLDLLSNHGMIRVEGELIVRNVAHRVSFWLKPSPIGMVPDVGRFGITRADRLRTDATSAAKKKITAEVVSAMDTFMATDEGKALFSAGVKAGAMNDVYHANQKAEEAKREADEALAALKVAESRMAAL